MRPVALEPRGTLDSFVDPRTGEPREILQPDGPPSGRQLLALWHRGAIALVLPDPWNQFTKGEAAWAIDYTRENP